MQTFVSSISNKTYPTTEKVPGKLIRDCIVDEIKREHPDFNDASTISISELNEYRNRYIQNSVTKEMGKLTEMEALVVKALQNDETLSDKLNEDQRETITFGQRLADKVASFGGSWTFIFIFFSFLIGWMIINIAFLTKKPFDPYPFILLNLILSCLAAVQAPVIMMSQNRQEDKDRKRAKNDYMINLKSELEIRLLHEKIDHLLVYQQERLVEIQQIQMDMMNDILKKLEKKQHGDNNREEA